MKTHGLFGSEFEDMINGTISDLRIKKLALIQKIATPIDPVTYNKDTKQITKAFFKQKSTVDYIGLVQEIPVCFDAKECTTTKFPLKNIHNHQALFMKEFEEQGGVSFLLIYFKNEALAYYMRFAELCKYYDIKEVEYAKNIDDGYFKMEELDKNYFIDMKNKIKVNFLDKLQLDINSR